MVDQKRTLIVHGGTSTSGKHVLTFLEQPPQAEQFDFILAGENQRKLDNVNNKLKRKRKVVMVDLKNEESVRELIKQGDAVFDISGPFFPRRSDALMKECTRTGKHYIDFRIRFGSKQRFTPAELFGNKDQKLYRTEVFI